MNFLARENLLVLGAMLVTNGGCDGATNMGVDASRSPDAVVLHDSAIVEDGGEAMDASDARPDARSTPDAAEHPDALANDTGAGASDSGSDVGARDAGATDAGATDAGATDAGATDAGTVDITSCDEQFAAYTRVGVSTGCRFDPECFHFCPGPEDGPPACRELWFDYVECTLRENRWMCESCGPTARSCLEEQGRAFDCFGP